jgi:hypothetical protein
MATTKIRHPPCQQAANGRGKQRHNSDAQAGGDQPFGRRVASIPAHSIFTSPSNALPHILKLIFILILL